MYDGVFALLQLNPGFCDVTEGQSVGKSEKRGTRWVLPKSSLNFTYPERQAGEIDEI